MKKFIVAGVQRTGTTLITTSLNSHSAIHCAGELFKMIRSSWNRDVMDSGYRAYLDAAFHVRVADFFFRDQLVRAYLDRFFDKPEFGAVGFKLMLNQTRRRSFPMVVPYLIKQQVSVIHVFRENVLRTHLSRLMASHRSVYHATERTANLPKLSVPVDNLQSSLRHIEAEGTAWRGVFEGRVPYMSLSYENFTANTQAEAERLLSFLGLPAAKLHSPLVKIGPDHPRQIVANWDEVKNHLRGSPYGRWAT